MSVLSSLTALLSAKGPLTGGEICRELALEPFAAWQTGSSGQDLVSRVVGRRYLRLDVRVAGYARLSPSIMREFLNYTVFARPGDSAALEQRAGSLEKMAREISAAKIALALETVAREVGTHPQKEVMERDSCFIISGDVVYGMAHAEPRPEASTGKLVKGSDLDLIVVTRGPDEKLQADLDELLYREKKVLLTNPVIREELDYLVKPLGKVEEQLQFQSFRDMVASKILHEGVFLYGSRDLFARIKDLVRRGEIPQKIASLEQRAFELRVRAEKELRALPLDQAGEALMNLFYTTEEKEEIF